MNGSDDQKTKACVAVFVKGHQPHNAIMHYMLLLLFVASCCCCCSIYYTIYYCCFLLCYLGYVYFFLLLHLYFLSTLRPFVFYFFIFQFQFGQSTVVHVQIAILSFSAHLTTTYYMCQVVIELLFSNAMFTDRAPLA